MEEITALLKQSNLDADCADDGDVEDEFESYMEERLIADA